MFKYPLVFALTHLAVGAVAGYLAWWQQMRGGLVGGGIGILIVYAGVHVTGAYFVRREGRLPTLAERRSFLGVALGYLVLFNAASLWLAIPVLPALSGSGWLVTGVLTLALIPLGLWAAWAPTFSSMTKYLERRARSVA